MPAATIVDADERPNPESPVSPAARRTTLAILAIAVGGFAIGTTEFVTMGLLPQIADGTGVGIATAGHYVSAYALGVVVGAPLIAIAFAKAPRKGLLMGLMAFFAVAHLAVLAANTYPTVMAARFLAGMPHGAFFGIGGMFAMYSFITPTMTELAGLDERYIPWVLAAYGVGMVVGMVLSGRVANRVGVLKGIIGALAAIAVLLALFGWAAQILWLAVVMVFVLGLLPSIVVPLLQTRLMDVAHEGQSLAAALNHSTLNTANALGAWLGSIVLAAGWGYGAPSLVGAGLAVLGVGVAVLSAVLERRSRVAATGSGPQVEQAATVSAATNA